MQRTRLARRARCQQPKGYKHNMNIRAKMQCESVTQQSEGENKYAEQVKLRAVYGDGEENKTYADATPSATVDMTISNKGAWGAFEQGKEYYVDFTPAK